MFLITGGFFFCPMPFMRAKFTPKKKSVQTLLPILIEMLLIDLQT